MTEKELETVPHFDSKLDEHENTTVTYKPHQYHTSPSLLEFEHRKPLHHLY